MKMPEAPDPSMHAASGPDVNTPSVETQRLTLRAFRAEDIEPIYAIQRDQDAMRYTYTAPSRQDCAHRLRTYAALESMLGFAPWTVVLRAEDCVIGWGGLSIDPFDPGWGVEVSYAFHPAYWGRGYATELVHATIRHGFDRLALPVIGAFVQPENVASARVLEKCGFTRVGYEPQLERDHYEIQKSAWQGAAP